MAALLLAVRTLFPKAEQLFVVILSRPGRVDADPDMPEAPVLFQHVPYLPGVDKAGRVIVHVQGNAPDLRVAFQESSQRHMGGPAQGQAPAVPSPSLQLLQRGMGKGVNGRLEYGELTAARTIRRVAEAEFFIAAGHIFFQAGPNAPHTGKPRLSPVILSHEHTDRFVPVPCLIQKPQPEASADYPAADPPSLQV